MSDEVDSHDDSALNAKYVPNAQQLTAAAKALYRELMAELEEDVSPDILKSRILTMIDSLRYTLAVADTEALATALAQKLSIKALQFGLSNALHAELINLLGKIEDPVMIGRVLQCLIALDAFIGNTRRRQTMLDDLFSWADTDSNVALMDALIQQIGAIAVADGDLNRNAVSLGEELLEMTTIIEEMDESGRKVQLRYRTEIYQMLSQCAIHTQRWDEARDFAEKALDLAQTLNLMTAQAIAWHNLGLSWFYTNLDKAMTCLLTARDLYQRTGDVARNAMLELTIGGVYWRRHDFARAEEILSVCAPQLTGTYRAEAYNYLGLSRTELRQFGAARKALAEAMRLYMRLEMPYYVLQVRHSLAYLAFMRGNLQIAIQRLEQMEICLQFLHDSRRDEFIKGVRNDLAHYRDLMMATS